MGDWGGVDRTAKKKHRKHPADIVRIWGNMGENMQKILAVVMSLSLCILAPLQAYAEDKVVRLCTLIYPPYIYLEEGPKEEKVTGMAFDIVSEAFESQGYRMTVDLMPWSRVLTSAKKGKFDGVLMLFKTEERQTYLMYSQEVLLPEIVAFFKHKDLPVPFDGSFESIEHLRVSIVDKIWYGEKFDEAIKSGSLTHLRRVSSFEEALTMLEARRTDLVATSNRDVIYQTIAGMPELKNIVEVTPHIDALPSYMAFTKKRDMTAVRDAFDAGIQQMKIRTVRRDYSIVYTGGPEIGLKTRNRPAKELEKKQSGSVNRPGNRE